MSKDFICVGGRPRESRSSLQRYLSSELNSHPVGDEITGPLHAVLSELIEFHTDACQKIGCGVNHFRIEPAIGASRHFVAVRTDGSSTDFSYKKCLLGMSGQSLLEQSIKNVLRAAVNDQIEDFRSGSGAIVTCALTGITLAKWHAHIDHAFPDTFKSLVDQFMLINGLIWLTFPISAHRDGERGRTISDPQVLEDWRLYHNQHSYLRFVDPKLNTRIGNRDPASDPVIRQSIERIVDDAKTSVVRTSPDQHASIRTMVLSRSAQVFRSNPEIILKLERGDQWLANHSTDHRYDERQSQWLSWVSGPAVDAEAA